MNFIEQITNEIGCCIADRLGLASNDPNRDFGRLASPVMLDDGGKQIRIFVHGEKEILPEEGKTVAFHWSEGGRPLPKNEADPYSVCGDSDMILNMHFAIFYFDECSDCLPHCLLNCFADQDYEYKESGNVQVSGRAKWTRFDDNAFNVIKSVFPARWTKMQHKQQVMKTMLVDYQLTLSPCNYCQ